MTSLKDKITNLSYLRRSLYTSINTLEHPGTPHPPVTKDKKCSQSNKSDTTASAATSQPDTSAPTSTEDLDRDQPPVSGNPRNIGAVAGEPRSHPITMADDHDNDHDQI
ncbi:hypothetical protein AHAS_Ahas16G0207300 [Arachis hypogaea]